MIRALVIKELKETWLLMAAAALAYGWLLCGLTGWGPAAVETPTSNMFFIWINRWGIPFVDGGFDNTFIVITGLLAITFGLLQSVRESRQATYLFLLHRPWPRWAFFLTKLAVGATIILVISSLPILIYARWAATPGNVPAPFEWSMTGPAWEIWLMMPLIYLGAFLSGLRPARWHATRLLPLAASIEAVNLRVNWGMSMAWLAPIYLLFIGAICIMARERDYS